MGVTGKIPQSASSKGFGIFRAAVSRYLNAVSRYVPMYPKTRVRLQRLRGISIGSSVFIGSEVLFDEVFPQDIIIEDDVTIIARSTILAHAFYPTHFAKTLPNKLATTRLKKGCYIGLGVLILPGLTIGHYAIIGAGSVVTKDVPDFAIVLGNPARITAYVCQCGARLRVRFSKVTCTNCGRSYSKQGVTLQQIKKKSISSKKMSQ